MWIAARAALAGGGSIAGAWWLSQSARCQEQPLLDPSAVPLDAKLLPGRQSACRGLSSSTPESPLDILVVGGGATGTGVALDAVSRGLRTGLVEQVDFGVGTSSRSTKMIHGGVRYLEKAVFNLDYSQLKLVFEALQERRTMMENAPHLSRALPIMTPCYEWYEMPYYYAGLFLYDLLSWASGRSLTWSSPLSAAESMRRFPTLASTRADGKALWGSIEYYDGQFNDSRYAVALAQTAGLLGAHVLNHARVESLIKDPESGRVIGARVCDLLRGSSWNVYARVVVNATGPFTDGLRKMSQGEDAASVVMPSAGVHITLPDYYSPDNVGMIVPKTRDGRMAFMLPWEGCTVAGTTDAPTDVTLRPQAGEDDVQFILDAIVDLLRVQIEVVLQVRREDVQSVWSGIRPLAADPTKANTADAVREHVVVCENDGMITVTGGKWTTYRRMAQDAVDAAIKEGILAPARQCATERLKLVGAQQYTPAAFAHLAQEYKVPHRHGHVAIDVARHLSRSYGDQAHHVTDIATSERLGRRLVPYHDVIEAEVVYAARYEMCESAEDFLARRCRLAFLDVDAAREAAPRVVALLAREHGWWWSRQRRELSAVKDFLTTFEAMAPGKPLQTFDASPVTSPVPTT